MKNKVVCIVLLLLVGLAACKKKDDLHGDGYFAGSLAYTNEYTGEQQLVPLAGRRVYVAYFPSDTLNYIYSAVSNSEGYFQFRNMDKQKSYTLFFADSIGGLKFKAAVTQQPNSDTILLIAVPDLKLQNGITMQVQDNCGSRIQDANIYLYSNYDIYKADSAAGDVKGALNSVQSNQYGIGNWFNIAPATYYMIARKEAAGVLLLGYQQEKVETTGMTTTVINMAGPDVYAKNGLKTTVKDRWDNAMQQATVHIYDSYDIYRADSAENKNTRPAHSVTTNQYGIATWVNIVPRKYYVIVRKEADGVALVGYGDQQVATEGIVGTEIRVLDPAAYAKNMLLLHAEDTWAAKLQGVTAYVYDSYDLYRADSAGNSTGTAIHQMVTNQEGAATWLNLRAGKYYIIGIKDHPAMRLTGYRHAVVTANGTSEATVTLAPPAAKPMVNITVLDAFNTPVTGADIYIYTSQAAAQLDINYTAATYHLTSDLTGVASQQSIPAGNYYIKGVKSINTTTLTGSATIQVLPTGTSTAFVQLQ